ncbi:hypothetical protein [Sphingomonas sp. RB1R13]|uniref:hypothetical protein n=1 Tax=Sphingomonas sp. RB1R13 TaxID=3096159 RepID=UPI002FC6CD88
MSLPPRIVLHSPVVDQTTLGPFVEQCLKDGVRLLAIWGEGAEALEDDVDCLVIGDGVDKSRFLVTSAHSEDSLEEVLDFASGWHCERDGLTEVRL